MTSRKRSRSRPSKSSVDTDNQSQSLVNERANDDGSNSKSARTSLTATQESIKTTTCQDDLKSRWSQVLLGRDIQSRMKVNVKEDDCDHMPRISGIAVLPDGHVVISDYINDTVNLLDNSWTLKERLQVDAFPSDIAVVDAKTVIVSSMSHIQFVNVLPHLTAGRKVKPLKRSRGVVVFGDEIFVLCHLNLDLGEVKGFGLNLKIKRRLGFNKEDNTYLFKDPCKIAINSSGERLFVSDDRSVTCMTSSDGHVVFKYDELKCTIGLNCDAGDNILVCDLNNIEVINPDGRKRCTLLSEREFSEDLEDTVSSSPYQPCSIAHKNSDKTLIIGCYNCENIYLFKITQ